MSHHIVTYKLAHLRRPKQHGHPRHDDQASPNQGVSMERVLKRFSFRTPVLHNVSANVIRSYSARGSIGPSATGIFLHKWSSLRTDRFKAINLLTPTTQTLLKPASRNRSYGSDHGAGTRPIPSFSFNDHYCLHASAYMP